MPKFTLNISDARPDLVPDGVYEAVIKSVVVRPKKDDATLHQISVWVGINDDGPYHGRTMFRSFPYTLDTTGKDTTNLHWLISDLDLLGVEADENGDFDIDYDDTQDSSKGWPLESPDLIDTQCWVQVVTNDYEGKKTNRFSKFVKEPEGQKLT